MSVSSHRYGKGPCKAKVGQHELPILVDKNVLWLQVAVHDAVGVAVGNASQQLVGI